MSVVVSSNSKRIPPSGGHTNVGFTSGTCLLWRRLGYDGHYLSHIGAVRRVGVAAGQPKKQQAAGIISIKLTHLVVHGFKQPPLPMSHPDRVVEQLE